MRWMIFVFTVLLVQGCAKIEPGYVGILVNEYGSQKGVEDFPVRVGRVWYNPFTETVYKFPTFMQTAVWTKDKNEGSPNDDSITFNSVEGAVVNADIALSYSFDTDKVPQLFVEFRRDADSITHGYLRSQVRDAFGRITSSMNITDIFGSKKQELLESIKSDLNVRLGEKGFKLDTISFVGALRVDEKVSASINAVIEATQRSIEAENKIRQSEAEAQQLIAEAEGKASSILRLAESQAKANQIVAASLTPELVRWQAVQKWDGIMPRVTGGAMPIIDIGKQTE